MRYSNQAGERNKFPDFPLYGFIAGMVILRQVLRSSFRWLNWMGYLAGFLVRYLFPGSYKARGSISFGQPCNFVAGKLPVFKFFCPEFYRNAIG
jgi:hypothetical protein